MTNMTVLHVYLLDFVIFSCFYISSINKYSIAHLKMVSSEAYTSKRALGFFCYKKNPICIYKHPSVFKMTIVMSQEAEEDFSAIRTSQEAGGGKNEALDPSFPNQQ